jgi:hypothetical protein
MPRKIVWTDAQDSQIRRLCIQRSAAFRWITRSGAHHQYSRHLPRILSPRAFAPFRLPTHHMSCQCPVHRAAIQRTGRGQDIRDEG